MGAAARRGQPLVRPTTNITPAIGGKGAATPKPAVLSPPGQSSGVPPQGGKGQNFGPNVFPAPQVQQPQVPAQGGKMSPLIQQVLNNQQQAQIQQPQVQQPLVQQRDPQVQQPFSGFPRPMLPPGVQMPVGLPARPISPQVMPAQGLMGLQQTLAGQQPVDPRRLVSPPAPGLNGVPGNQNPLYFGPGYK